MYGNSNDNRYLLIMDGHNSHIVHEKGRDGGVSYRRDMYDFTRVKWSWRECNIKVNIDFGPSTNSGDSSNESWHNVYRLFKVYNYD